MEKTWSHDFYRETDPVKRQQILKAHAGEEEAWAEEYRNRLWTARYGKYRLQKDEFVKCLMELKYLAEGSTLEHWGRQKKDGSSDPFCIMPGRSDAVRGVLSTDPSGGIV